MEENCRTLGTPSKKPQCSSNNFCFINYSKCNSFKEPFYYAYGFCGLRIHTERRGSGMSGPSSRKAEIAEGDSMEYSGSIFTHYLTGNASPWLGFYLGYQPEHLPRPLPGGLGFIIGCWAQVSWTSKKWVSLRTSWTLFYSDS